jgi:hydrogenase nickel incorporation protein HypA/HybF
MHELGLAVDIVDIASEALAGIGPVRVKAVRVRVGPLSGVVKDALLFSFGAAAAGTPLADARLDIEDVPVAAWCGVCNAEREPADLARRRCPQCQAAMPRLLRGDELEIVGLEVFDA